MSFWFGDFELDPERRQLLRSGEPVPLEPKDYELLSLLVERRPRALSRAQIRDAIWPGTFITESTLAVVVNAVREALGDDARHPRFIRTVGGGPSPLPQPWPSCPPGGTGSGRTLRRKRPN
jgi:DNA-binding winged helix-turn-helix (wHTH) protein